MKNCLHDTKRITWKPSYTAINHPKTSANKYQTTRRVCLALTNHRQIKAWHQIFPSKSPHHKFTASLICINMMYDHLLTSNSSHQQPPILALMTYVLLWNLTHKSGVTCPQVTGWGVTLRQILKSIPSRTRHARKSWKDFPAFSRHNQISCVTKGRDSWQDAFTISLDMLSMSVMADGRWPGKSILYSYSRSGPRFPFCRYGNLNVQLEDQDFWLFGIVLCSKCIF